jgi:hypothetical protein
MPFLLKYIQPLANWRKIMILRQNVKSCLFFSSSFFGGSLASLGIHEYTPLWPGCLQHGWVSTKGGWWHLNWVPPTWLEQNEWNGIRYLKQMVYMCLMSFHLHPSILWAVLPSEASSGVYYIHSRPTAKENNKLDISWLTLDILHYMAGDTWQDTLVELTLNSRGGK